MVIMNEYPRETSAPVHFIVEAIGPDSTANVAR